MLGGVGRYGACLWPRPAREMAAAVVPPVVPHGIVGVVDLCVSLYKFSNVELHSQG